MCGPTDARLPSSVFQQAAQEYDLQCSIHAEEEPPAAGAYSKAQARKMQLPQPAAQPQQQQRLSIAQFKALHSHGGPGHHQQQQQQQQQSPPSSPRSSCSTPGRRSSDAVAAALRACSQPCGRAGGGPDLARRYSHEVSSNQQQRSPRGSAGRWLASDPSFGASSALSYGSSSCGIVRAISYLGLEGPPAAAGGCDGYAGSGCCVRRGSISKAKRILAEAIACVPGAHGLASCGSAAADTGVLSPLLTIIANDGVVVRPGGSPLAGSAAGCPFGEAAAGYLSSSSSDARRPVSRRSSFSDAMLLGYGRPSMRRVTRNASFSEAAGGLNSPPGALDGASSGCLPPEPIGEGVPLSPSAAAGVGAGAGAAQQQQQQQRVVDCLDTIRYLAMDESNRAALIDLGAVELLLGKLQAPGSGNTTTKGSSGGSSSGGTSSSSVQQQCWHAVVMEASLAALTALARHDATKLRVWDNPHSNALLQLLGARHTSPLTKATHLCAAQLAWSHELERGSSFTANSGVGSSSVFDSVSSSSHSGRDDAGSTSSSSYGSNVLLTPSLIPAIAAGLHPNVDAPVLLSLLKLLGKAAASSCLASPSASTPCSSASSSSSSSSSCDNDGQELCAVQQAAAAAWRVGWQQVIFALPPLLACCPTELPASSSMTLPRRGTGVVGQHAVVGAALELLILLIEQHPELHGLVCAAGCVPRLLTLLSSGGAGGSSSGGSSERSLNALSALAGLLDSPAAQELLGREQALMALLRVLDASASSVDVCLAVIHVLRRLAGASEACTAVLKGLGAVHVVAALLHQVHDGEVRRSAVVLLQLLGKQVVVRPRRTALRVAQPGEGGSSSRSSLESGSSGASEQRQQQHATAAVAAAAEVLEAYAAGEPHHRHQQSHAAAGGSGCERARYQAHPHGPGQHLLVTGSTLHAC